jgi:hypothetical protein
LLSFSGVRSGSCTQHTWYTQHTSTHHDQHTYTHVTQIKTHTHTLTLLPERDTILLRTFFSAASSLAPLSPSVFSPCPPIHTGRQCTEHTEHRTHTATHTHTHAH